MSDFIVTRKIDGIEVLRYSAAQAQEVNGYNLTDYDHTEWFHDAPVAIPTSRVMTKLEYLRRFTTSERVAIRAAASANPVLDDYLKLMELAQEINMGDADTVAAVTMLEQVGLLAPGRASEVLNG